MKKSRLVKIQHTRVIDTKDCGESSPYRQWVEEHGFFDDSEVAQANPDTLTDAQSFYPVREPQFSVGDISRKLSGMQLKVFELYVNEMRDEKEIAAMLNIKFSTVRTHLMRIRKRFRKDL